MSDRANDGSYVIVQATFSDNGEVVTQSYDWENLQRAIIFRKRCKESGIFSKAELFEVKPFRVFAAYDENMKRIDI